MRAQHVGDLGNTLALLSKDEFSRGAPQPAEAVVHFLHNLSLLLRSLAPRLRPTERNAKRPPSVPWLNYSAEVCQFAKRPVLSVLSHFALRSIEGHHSFSAVALSALLRRSLIVGTEVRSSKGRESDNGAVIEVPQVCEASPVLERIQGVRLPVPLRVWGVPFERGPCLPLGNLPSSVP